MTAFPPPAPTATFPYRVLEKIGEGAMGEVYRAEDLDLARMVAIKVIRPEHASARGTDPDATVNRFLQEARAAAALSHPGVTTVHRVGTAGGHPYIAMEWLDGHTLEDILARGGRIPPEQAVRIGLQVLSALEAAHAAGIVHRDIKPDNLMVLPSGRIKVTDFGVARVRGSDLAHTQAGMIVGTPQYAAPEQLAGGAIDHRIDLYALACVLYEALVGRPPFEASSIYELVQAVHAEAPRPPSALVDGLPPGLDAGVLRGLAKRPEDRFASAADMRAALDPFRTRRAAPPPPTEATPGRAVPAVAPTHAQVATVQAVGEREHELVMSVVRQWPTTEVPRQDRDRLLQRLVERPLHAPAFTGALVTDGACILISDGIMYRVFDPATGRVGDALLEALPAQLGGTLFAVPAGLETRLVALLASLLVPAVPRLSGLSSSFADLPQLAGKLAAEGFDGAIRFGLGARLGFALFCRGQRVLDVFGDGWPARDAWEQWIGGTGAIASVEPIQSVFPAATFRQQLAGLVLEVVRPTTSLTSSIRSDTTAAARAIDLRPCEGAAAAARRGPATLQALVTSDPAYGAARWIIAELGAQFAQHGRAGRWKGLIEPLDRIGQVRLHHGLARAGGDRVTFDAVAYDGDGRVVHVIDRVARGTRAAVEAFIERATAVRRARDGAGELGAAILVAPTFDEDALEAYLAALRTGGALRASLDALSHREGYLRLGMRQGFHVLLVEETADGRRRPLVVE
ncbi:MAG: protein kinase [Myxococcales bacterium]|nr:protein kinase [Myxococcales bacterium]